MAEMIADSKIKKYSVIEVVLLCIFALSLLIGRFVVIQHRKIRLSKPIELEFTGLSVALPTGHGWQEKCEWQYHQRDNDIMLTSRLMVGRQIAAIVQWRYMLAPEKTGIPQQLSNRVVAAGAEISNTGQINCGNVMMEWAQAKVPGGIRDVFFGIAELQNGRTIELEVIAPADPDLAQEVFGKVAKILKFTPNDLLEKGAAFVEQIKDAGIRKLLEAEVGSSGERVYLIGDNMYNIAGFSIDVFEDLGADADPAGVKAKQALYVLQANEWAGEDSSFDCDDRFDEFTWQSKYSRPNAESTPVVAIEQVKNGPMRVISQAFDKEKEYWVGRGTIAKILVDPILKVFLDSSISEMVVDIVYSNGIIVPTMVSKADPFLAKAESDNFSYAVRLDFLHGEEQYQIVYFDRDGKIVKKLDQKEHLLPWYRSDKKTLTDRFGNSGGYVEQVFRLN
jgi:hypothetical protein